MMARMTQSSDNFTVSFHDSDRIERVARPHSECILPFAVSDLYHAPVKSVVSLTKGKDVKTVHDVCLDMKKIHFPYQPGDTIGILPQNSIEEVNFIIEHIGCTEIAHETYTLTAKCAKKKIPPHVPSEGTIKQTFMNNLDIRSPPKKLFLKALVQYTVEESDSTCINELCSPKKSAEYNRFITEEYSSLVDLFRIFPSCKPPFCLFVEHLPRLHPRPYSIANSPILTCSLNSEIHFVYSLVTLPNNLKGVCTGWLHELTSFLTNTDKESEQDALTMENITVPIYLRKSNNFRLPDDPMTDLILIAAGAGIAPFIGFLHHRMLQNISSKNFGTIWLLFGCRYSERDFLFKDEIENFLKQRILTRISVAFSRENGTVKYVQDNICENSQDFITMICKDDSTKVFVCGSKKMCSGVFETAVQSFSNINHVSQEEAEDYFKNLRQKSRYIEDTWS